MLRAATWDAVVVGGGPAGSAFAIELARHGRRVALLERTQHAQHKVCGEFLSRETTELLSRFDVDLDGLGARSIDRFRLIARERQADIVLPFRARAVSRFRMDEALLQSAAQQGVHVVRGARVTHLDHVGSDGVARTDQGSWRGTIVGLATGKHALRGFSRPAGTMVGFKMHLAAPNAERHLADTVQLAFFDGGYAGACLVEDGILSIGWVMRPDLLHRVGAGWQPQADFLSSQSPLIASLLTGSRPLIDKPISTAGIPYGFLRTRPVGSATYPLGDQLAVVPSFTGDGLAIALASGVAAAQAAMAGVAAPRFQRRMIRKLRPQFRFAAALGTLLQTPALSGLTVAAARALPAVASQMVRATRLRGFDRLLAERSTTLEPSTPETINGGAVGPTSSE